MSLTTQMQVLGSRARRQLYQSQGRKEVENIAQLNGFTSREPKAEVKAEQHSKEPEGQINIRAKQAVLDRFRDFGRQQEPRWPSGYVLERALEALERGNEEIK